MEREEFERQINAVVPWPDRETTADLFALGRELGDGSEYGGAQDILNSLSFIARHFDKEITQGVYEIIQYGSALPDEMVAAAVLMASRGCSPREMARAANGGELMCLHTPKDAEELSPLAVCCIVEDGKLHLTYTEHFGSFDPETVLRDAREYARQHGISVLDTLLQHTAPDGTVGRMEAGAQRLLSGSQPEIAKAMTGIFTRYPAVAAQMMLDACWGITVVERNPLWLELKQRQEIVQDGMELRM